MNEDAPEKPAAEIVLDDAKFSKAWQPFTPGGVAAFALAPLVQVLFLQLVMTSIAAGVVVWFLNANYAPSISEAIKNLPDEAAFYDGKLTNVPSGILSQQKFLSFLVDLKPTGVTGQTADLQVELREDYFQICSLFGCGRFVYPNKNFSIGGSTAEPWWSAREPIILAICGALTFVQVWLSWIAFAVIYAPIAKLIAYFSDRELSWRGSWRLVSVAQTPGAVLMSLAIVLYGIQVFDLIRFLFFFILHFIVTWIYLGAAPFFLPRVSAEKVPAAKNPFE